MAGRQLKWKPVEQRHHTFRKQWLLIFPPSATITLPRGQHLKQNQVVQSWFLRGSNYRGSCHQLLCIFPASSIGLVQLCVAAAELGYFCFRSLHRVCLSECQQFRCCYQKQGMGMGFWWKSRARHPMAGTGCIGIHLTPLWVRPLGE